MNNKQWDTLWLNGVFATCANTETPYGLISKGAMAVQDGRIAWIGPMSDLPKNEAKKARIEKDLEGRLVTPGLIDAHTHLVYAGNRADEFEMRLKGVTYEAIAKQGGGIRSTVSKTQHASFETLLKESLPRAKALLKEGVTTLEIKSGYGLTLESELNVLRVAKKIGELLPLTIYPTFLGAHTCPVTYQGRPDEYIDLVCEVMIPAVAKEKLANAVDVFCERIGFSLAQTERVFKAAKHYGLSIKCHAEQLSNLGASKLAAEYGALSVDHLEHLSEEDVIALKKANVVALLLPGAFYFLRETKAPPIDLLRHYQVPMAIATDCNPGTSPVTSLLLIMNMACTLFRLTPEEALRGVTVNAAKALNKDSECGTLSVGMQADCVAWNVEHPAVLSYYVGFNPCYEVMKAGKTVKE